jgi:hypothetical protein
VPVHISVCKPWDSLRGVPKKPPISEGCFKTTQSNAGIHVKAINKDRFGHNAPGMVSLQLGQGYTPEDQRFRSGDLRELASFANELADQLDGKC